MASFEQIIQDFADHLEWGIEWNGDAASVDFEFESGEVRPLFITNNGATVEFDVGESMEASLVKLYDKLESNKDKVPPGVVGPMVKPKGVDDVPVVTLTVPR